MTGTGILVVASLIALICWGAAFLAYHPGVARRVRFPLGNVLLMLGWLAITLYAGWLCLALQRLPMRTMGETALWFAFFLPLLGLLVEWRWRTTLHRYPLLVAAMLAVGMLLAMSGRLDKTQAPLLDSPLFAPHVLAFLLSYAALAIAAAMAGYLLFRSLKEKPEIIAAGAQEARRFIVIAFPLMTLGNVLGALWGQAAWGAYWQWDVKETMALVTWLLYLAYLHADARGALRPRQHLVFSVVGFLALLLCWLGVRILPAAAESLHVYGG
jgi:ABC-type transport system involved in cytochrome c biogenesis permease subunit